MEFLVQESTHGAISEFEAPVNADDAHMIIQAWNHQLVLRPEDPSSRSLCCLAMLPAHATSAIQRSFIHDTYPSLIDAASSRLWLELPVDPLSDLTTEACENLMCFANLLIRNVRCATRLPPQSMLANHLGDSVTVSALSTPIYSMQSLRWLKKIWSVLLGD